MTKSLLVEKQNKVNGLDAESSDPDWSINIKKALATMLQVDLVAGDNFGKGDNAFIRTVEVIIIPIFLLIKMFNLI